MKKLTALCLVLLLSLSLSACGEKGADFSPGRDEVLQSYKILSTNLGILAFELASDRPELTFVGATNAEITDQNGNALTPDDLRGGMVIDVIYNGMVQETWPCSIHADRIRVSAQEDDFVGLYRTVLLDLWETDPALNEEAEMLGLDLSSLTNLSDIEREALSYLLSCDVELGLSYILGTWEELCQQGYIDRENLIWEDGVFFSIALEDEPGERSFSFDAQKWRSGLGSIFFEGCTARREKDGQWSYEAGAFAIS